METRARTSAQRADGAERNDAGAAGADLPQVPRTRHSRLIWLILVLAGLAAAVWSYDQVFSDRVVAVRERIDAVLGPAPGPWPSRPVAMGVFIIVLAILASFRNRRRLLVGFVVPMLLSAVVAEVIKRLVGRARPDMHLGPQAFDRIQALSWGGYQSFPSGDATTAITLALLLGLYFPRARWVFYVIAGLVGLSRIVLARHFISDVLAGYMVGAAAVYVCVRLLGPTFYARDFPRGAAG
jgi:membrane-associated phospholipid phosphatase